jgi:DNA polymerase-1
VGPKTAAKWLQAHGSLEGVMQHAMELEPARFREVVAASGELLRRNLRLTTLNLALPVLPPAAARPRLPELYALLEELEMRSSLAEARRRYEQPELF